MVSLDLLSSLDGLIWLQSGKQVGELFHQHQTTVSRNLKKCSEVFGFSFQKSGGKWSIDGDTHILDMERQVHQLARLQKKAPLRLDVNYWFDGVFCSPPPDGWLIGNSKRLGTQHSQELLLSNIVDAWLCPQHEAPSEGEELKMIHLCKLPIQLLVSPDHPLLKQGEIKLDQVKSYPIDSIPPKTYPGTDKILQTIGVSPTPRRSNKQSINAETTQEGSAKTIHLGSVLTKNQHGLELVPLQLSLGINTGVVLITRRENSNKPSILHLTKHLEQHLKSCQSIHPEIQIPSS